jgi:hypothetical protein
MNDERRARRNRDGATSDNLKRSNRHPIPDLLGLRFALSQRRR